MFYNLNTEVQVSFLLTLLNIVNKEEENNLPKCIQKQARIHA